MDNCRETAMSGERRLRSLDWLSMTRRVACRSTKERGPVRWVCGTLAAIACSSPGLIIEGPPPVS
jgi:hypothetical protein